MHATVVNLTLFGCGIYVGTNAPGSASEVYAKSPPIVSFLPHTYRHPEIYIPTHEYVVDKT